jgi:16S rRNA (guanine1207-N2)-methyltransferase
MTSPAPHTLDVYLKKRVDLRVKDRRLTFAVSQSLFSSHQVDVGTLQLLKTLEDTRLPEGSKVLDLGCGYGPLGLTLGALNQGAEVHLVDRDALAVAFSQLNAEQNSLSGARAYGSLGYDEVQARDFDLIVANIPGKAGETVIRALLLDARAFLALTGWVAIVVVAPLERLVTGILNDPGIEILHHQTAQGSPGRPYAVFHYRFTQPGPDAPWVSGLDRGIYDREELAFVVEDMTLPMRTAHGLPEFDTLSFRTQLLVKAIRDLEEEPGSIAVFNPSQGHVPVVLWRAFAARSSGSLAMILTDRDLLSLRYARMNLVAHGCEASTIESSHLVDLLPDDRSPDLLVGVLREDEGPSPLEHALIRLAGALRPGAQLLIAGGSTPVTRVVDAKEIGKLLRLVKRKRNKGNSTALLQRR